MVIARCLAIGLAAGGSVLLFGSLARASAPDSDWDGGYDQRAERRSDVMLGFFGGLALGSGLGYPNEIDKIDEPEFESSTDFGVGNGGGAFLGVAFSDYLSFGIGTLGFSLKGNDIEGSGGGLIFHIEAFPLFGASQGLKDLGIFADFGAGGATLEGGAGSADGGLMSIVGAGVVYEPWRIWQFAFGPSISYTRMWSPSLTFEGVLIGGRVAFYGGP